MRIPTRKAQMIQQQINEPDRHVTRAAIERMKRELVDLETSQRPAAVAEVVRTGEMGDFSENAAYQMAKAHLRRINGRITLLETRLAYAIPIEQGSTNGVIRLGSRVRVRADGREREFEIVGAQETNPARGRISHSSPIGSALIGHRVGETIELTISGKQIRCEILKVV